MKMRKLRVSLYGGGTLWGRKQRLALWGTPKGAYGDGLTPLCGALLLQI